MLLEFYGTECPHCVRMHPLIEKLESEEKVQVQKFETWHHEENEKKRQEYDKGYCGGVPFFFNTETGKYLCGETDYESLKKWALGQ
jgi:thiol-disulfide isomerase/thioredoxin